MISTTDRIKHTPGPWVWRGKSGSLHRVGTPPYAYGELVLAPDYEHDSGVDTKVSDADAALIAAAPDTYASLRAMTDWVKAALECKSWHWDVDQREAAELELATALEAIAKAEGRS